jgi:putative ABC transport system permease protein
MFKNYLRIAARILARNKLYTIINVLGLAIGVCGCIVIWLVGSYELSFDGFHPDGARIYRVVEGGKRGERKSIDVLAPMAQAIRETIPGIEAVTAYYDEFGMREVKVPTAGKPTATFPCKMEGEDRETGVIIADADWFHIFSYDWLAGSPTRALKEPFQVVLTEKRARLYFGDIPPTDAIGRELIYGDSMRLQVSGVVRDWTSQSDLAYTDIISFPTIAATSLKQGRLNDWILRPIGMRYTLPSIYVKLAKGTKPVPVEAQMNRILAEHVVADRKRPRLQALQPLRQIHFNSDIDDFRRKAQMPTLYGLAGIALFILILAAVNFVNLATAQSLQRSKEIGVRKVLGSGRRGLVFQFLIETGLLTTLAMTFATVLVYPVMGYFREYIPEGVHFFPFAPANLLFLAGTIVVVTIAAGFYPARVLAGYQPVVSLKGSGTIRGGEKWWLRRSLIVFQFSISLIFIIVTLVIGNQIRFMLNTDYGFRTDALVTVQGQGGFQDTTTNKLKLLEQGFSQLSGVTDVAREFSPPIGGNSWIQTFEYRGRQPKEVTGNFSFGDEHFIPFYGMRVLAGRNIRNSDSLIEVVINETASKQFGFKDPSAAIGQAIWFEKKPLPIVGVVSDFHMASFREAIQPVVIGHNPAVERFVGVRLASAGLSVDRVKAILDAMYKVYNEFYGSRMHSGFEFMDDHIREMYQNEQKTASLVKVAMGLAVFISCMGLFGLSLFTAERRANEIAIRKVLGATTGEIGLMLNKDFVRLVLLALAIASPVAWILAHRWLQDFAYRVGVSGWVFVLAGLGAIAFAVLTVSYQSLRAALANPVKSLRRE